MGGSSSLKRCGGPEAVVSMGYGLSIDGNSPAGPQRCLEKFDTGERPKEKKIKLNNVYCMVRGNSEQMMTLLSALGERKDGHSVLYFTVLRTVEWNPR